MAQILDLRNRSLNAAHTKHIYGLRTVHTHHIHSYLYICGNITCTFQRIHALLKLIHTNTSHSHSYAHPSNIRQRPTSAEGSTVDWVIRFVRIFLHTMTKSLGWYIYIYFITSFTCSLCSNAQSVCRATPNIMWNVKIAVEIESEVWIASGNFLTNFHEYCTRNAKLEETRKKNRTTKHENEMPLFCCAMKRETERYQINLFGLFFCAVNV